MELYNEVRHTINRVDYGALYWGTSYYYPRGLWGSILRYFILLTAWIMGLYTEVLHTINRVDYGAP